MKKIINRLYGLFFTLERLLHKNVLCLLLLHLDRKARRVNFAKPGAFDKYQKITLETIKLREQIRLVR